MDEMDKFFNGDPTQSPSENPTVNSGTPDQRPYTQPNPTARYDQGQQPMNSPKYDAFMYEPIGFEDAARRQAAAAAVQAEKEKTRHVRQERAILVIFAVLVIATILFGFGGIVADIMTGSSRIKTLGGDKVVIYQESKPKGTTDLSDFQDENGKYTTEGAAAAVRDSIVEIKTYSDAFHKDLLGMGSGVILNEDGYIVTNAHVLDSEGYHDVHTADGSIYSAKIIGRDSKTDIAVLKISGTGLSPATLGDSDEVLVGEQVIAVGNPAGLSNTVTDGIISAVNREIRSDSTGFEMKCIQTNADISPGNSGGALVNMYGQVIGITSSKYISSYYEGLGFAITINEAKPIIEELISNGYIGGRFRIGIVMIDMAGASKIATIEEDLGYSLPEDFYGIYITELSEDCDIYNTALKPKDFITEINGIPVRTYDELYDTISESYGAGDTVPATCASVDKDGNIKEYKIEFKLMEDTSGDY